MFNKSDIRMCYPQERNVAQNIVIKMYTKLYLVSIHQVVSN